MSANSGQFLHDNIRFAMQHLDTAPPDAQKALFRALIQEIVIHDGKIEIKMHLNATLAQAPADLGPINGKTPRETGEALTVNGSSLSERLEWLPGLDSNQQPIG